MPLFRVSCSVSYCTINLKVTGSSVIPHFQRRRICRVVSSLRRKPTLMTIPPTLTNAAALLHSVRSWFQPDNPAEWGMRCLQGSFGRLRIPMPADDAEYRYRLLEVCCRLHNVRTCLLRVGSPANVILRCMG
jgi:hypothetical protein